MGCGDAKHISYCGSQLCKLLLSVGGIVILLCKAAEHMNL
jgi:hypothetical protein